MIISKAIEFLKLIHQEDFPFLTQDDLDAIGLGIEALHRIEDVRLHPFHPVYSPLLGESMPERGIR